MNDANYDQVVVNIGLEWLTQYARFLRRSPELVERLAGRSGEFELIPIPKVLLERLAVPGLVGSGGLGGVDPEIQRFVEFDPAKFPLLVETSRGRALDTIREFAAAIDAGNSTAAYAMLSPRFINPDGENAAEVHDTLERLFERTSNRRLQVHSIEEKHGAEAEFAAKVNATWTACAEQDRGADPVSETVWLEILLDRQPEGDWRISGVRSV